MQGAANINGIDLKPGELAGIQAGASYQIQQSGSEMAVLFKSFVP
jgi:hypothetical protein